MGDWRVKALTPFFATLELAATHGFAGLEGKDGDVRAQYPKKFFEHCTMTTLADHRPAFNCWANQNALSEDPSSSAFDDAFDRVVHASLPSARRLQACAIAKSEEQDVLSCYALPRGVEIDLTRDDAGSDNIFLFART